MFQKRIEKLLCLLLAGVLLCVPLSGVKESFEVQNVESMAMVKSVGLDREENCTLSFAQSVIADSSPRHSQALVSAEAESFTQAEKQAQILADKYLTLSYARHFLIGMQSAERGLSEALQYLLASPVLQLSSYVYICEGSAQELLEKMCRDEIATNEVLRNLNLAGKQEGSYAPVTVVELAKALCEKRSICVPIVAADPAAKNTAKETVVVFKGYAVIKNGRLISVLPQSLSEIYNMLSAGFQRGTLSCEGADVFLKNCRCKPTFRFENGKPREVLLQLQLVSEPAQVKKTNLRESRELEALVQEQKQILLRQAAKLLEQMRASEADFLNLREAAVRASGGRLEISEKEVLQADIKVQIQIRQRSVYTLSQGG